MCQRTRSGIAQSSLTSIMRGHADAAVSVEATVQLYLRHEGELHAMCAVLMVVVGVVVWCVELGMRARAPYGRYASISAARLYGPPIPSRAAWAFQESWSVTVPLALLSASDLNCLASMPNRVLLAMFVGHYTYRSTLYPLRMRGGSGMPVGVCALASLFCAFNGFVQARMWTALTIRTLETPGELLSFGVGCAIWAA